MPRTGETQVSFATIGTVITHIRNGRLRVLVDPTPFTGLEQVSDAVEHLLAGRNSGKVVIRIP